MEPTTQAREMIALMLQADQKGLSADDYAGPRWNDRLTKLKPATRQPTEAEAVKFDLALTVCAMRYVSDLHIGKVNPKHFAFALDDESGNRIWPNFLKTTCDVAGILAQVEPPYPGYRRTLAADLYGAREEGRRGTASARQENGCAWRRLPRRPATCGTATDELTLKR
jgi:hypothetical protein